MDPDYYYSYSQKSISHRKLFTKIAGKYSPDIGQTEMNYDELMYLFDQQCLQPRKANRSLSQEIFQQTAKYQTTNLHSFIRTYIENLETAKICLQRHENLHNHLQNQIEHLKTTRNAYIYLQMIQASVFSHFSRSPTFSYQINPSSIAPVTVSNVLNPSIDNQFTLALEDVQQFNITFYQSGIQIFKWWFPDVPDLPQGEYLRSIKTENVSFQVKIKYIRKGQLQEDNELLREMKKNQEALKTSSQAFKELCDFQPFSNRRLEGKINEKEAGNGFIDKIVDIFPFVGEYVRNLHLFLLIFTLVSCFFSYYSSVEFIDIILAFYGLSLLYDLSLKTTQIPFLILEITLILSIIKTIWSLAVVPFYNNAWLRDILVVISMIVKVVLIILVGICVLQDKEVNVQKRIYFYSLEQSQVQVTKGDQDDIWQHSFLEDNNF